MLLATEDVAMTLLQKDANQECLGYFEMACAGLCNSEKRCASAGPVSMRLWTCMQQATTVIVLLQPVGSNCAGWCPCTTSVLSARGTALCRISQVSCFHNLLLTTTLKFVDHHAAGLHAEMKAVLDQCAGLTALPNMSADFAQRLRHRRDAIAA